MAKDNPTYETVIGIVKGKLERGRSRVADWPAALRWSWWPNEPDFQDHLLSDYGVDTIFTTVEKEYREEIQAISEALEELSYEPEVADWIEGSDDATQRISKSLGQASEAMSVWDQVGIPVRLHGNMVFRIWSPRDIMGSPIIRALPVDVFVNRVAIQTASDRVTIERLEKNRGRWRIAAMILAVAILLGISIWVL